MVSFYSNKIHKKMILFISSFFFFSSSLLFFFFNFDELGFQFITELYFFDTYVLMGIDSISLLFILLTTLIIPLCLLFNWNKSISLYEQKLFFSTVLLLELLLLFVFTVLDLVAFYILFEFILIPFYVIVVLYKINNYNRSHKEVNRKLHAFFLLFFYTIFGSLIMLIGILLIYVNTGSTMIPLLWYFNLNHFLEYFLWILFFIAFSVKIPIVPLHLWLPEAHVESPTEGSVILAAILLKIGLYGFIRIVIPSFQEATIHFSLIVWLFCFFSILYTSITACVQIDIKRIIAYASIGHMNLCVLGLFSLEINSITGSLILMFSHGIASAGLFFCIGVLYSRFHTKNIKYFNGISQLMPIFSIFFFFFIVSNFGLPGTMNFLGELLILMDFFKKFINFIFLCFFFSIFLSSFYSILLYNKILFGNINRLFFYNIRDLSLVEFFVFIILSFFIFFMGYYPLFILDFFKNDIYNYYSYLNIYN